MVAVAQAPAAPVTAAVEPAVSVLDVTVSESGAGDTYYRRNDLSVRVTFELTEPAAGRVGVGWTTVDGSAVAGRHFQPSQGTLWIPKGVTSKIVTLRLINDRAGEPDTVLRS